uniref:SGNH hydrolase-type esterase domain-containing protein n=1 Tax=Lactuca sativa TaxID=4236 RepID=A0A9R1UP86_LACSA|nr:hypothetical protein LSAT_V11C800429310 [Lactuca sativa]
MAYGVGLESYDLRPYGMLITRRFVVYMATNHGCEHHPKVLVVASGGIISLSYVADIFMRGYSGWNSRQAWEVVEQVFPKDDAVKPSLVIVYFGGNNSVLYDPNVPSSHVPLDEYVQNMRNIATHLHSLSETTRLIFLTAPSVNEEQMTEVLGDGIHFTAAASATVASEIRLAIFQADWTPSLCWDLLPTEFDVSVAANVVG